ncbi:MAG: xanthine dehydrogenase family protein subunit M [Gammaproteobacteria bacterium]|nr:xanthine dehydrogenase family protein subunit M [Gammaproteobacteria bacterium]
MHRFNFRQASSIAEAHSTHAASDDAVYIAGGMTLIPSLKLRLASPNDVVDLSRIDGLSTISSAGGVLSVGATARHCDVAQTTDIPALASLASRIGDAQVRNCGTIGGSLANNDPAADYPAAVVGLGATVHTNSRAIAGDEFFVDLFETALEDGEIITRVDFSIPSRAAYAKFANPASRFAIVGVMVAETSSGVRVGVTGAGACAFRMSSFEAALSSNMSASALDGIAVDSSEFNDDLHASAQYRANLVTVMAKRAVAQLTA